MCNHCANAFWLRKRQQSGEIRRDNPLGGTRGPVKAILLTVRMSLPKRLTEGSRRLMGRMQLKRCCEGWQIGSAARVTQFS
jgi:hypothetical protein